MELPCTTYLLCGVLLYMAYTVSGQGGGLAIGFGVGDHMVDGPFGGEMPAPFLAAIAAQGTETTGIQTTVTPPLFTGTTGAGTSQPTASTSTMGGGFNPSDALAMLGGPGPGVAVNSANANNDYLLQTQSQTGQNSVQTSTPVIQIDPVTGSGFTLQNEAYTPIGSIGNLVKVPTNGNESKDAAGKIGQTLTNANQAFENVVVQPVTHSIDNAQSASNNIANNFAGSNTFNHGSGKVDEITALKSASLLLSSPVDMSNFLPPPYSPDGIQTSLGNKQPNEPTSINIVADSPVTSDFSANSNQGASINIPVIQNMNTNSNPVNDPAITDFSTNVNTGVAINVPIVQDMNTASDINSNVLSPPYSPDGIQIAQGNQQPNEPTNINIVADSPVTSDFSVNSNQGVSINVPVIRNMNTNSNLVNDPAIADFSTNVNTGVAVNVPNVQNMNAASDSNANFLPPPYSPDGIQISHGNQQPNEPTHINIVADSPVTSGFSANSNQGVSINVPVNTNSNLVNDPAITDFSTNVNTGVAVNVPNVQNMNAASDSNANFLPPPYSPDGIQIAHGNQQPNEPTHINKVADSPVTSDFSANSNQGVSLNVPVIQNMNTNSNLVNDHAITDFSTNVNTGVAVNVPNVQNMNTVSDINANSNPNVEVSAPVISEFSVNNNRGMSVSVPALPDMNANIHESAVVNNNIEIPAPNAVINTQPRDGILNEQGLRTGLRDMFSSHNALSDNSVGGIGTVMEPNTVPSNQPDTPHLQDLTAEGIYPFEGSFIARDGLLNESINAIQDMNTAIASHSTTTETLHLENPFSGINDVPPLTGTNGGPITNLVGVNPSDVTGSNQGSLSTHSIDAQIQAVDNTQSGNQLPGFIIGAGMPNAQLIQTGFVSEVVSPNINTGGGLSIGGTSSGMSGIYLPDSVNFQNADIGNAAINDVSAPITSGSNLSPQSNFVDNTQVASMILSQAIPGQAPTQQGINTAEIQTFKTMSPSIQQGIETSNMATLTLPDFTSLVDPVVPTVSLNSIGVDVNNMVDRSFAINPDMQPLPISNEPLPIDFASSNMQQPSAALNNQAFNPNLGMIVPDINPNIINTQTSFGGPSELQTPTAFQSQAGSVSNQQIVNVQPGWMSNVFGSIGQGLSIQPNTDQPGMSVRVLDASKAVDLTVGARNSPINPSEPLPMQTVINPIGGSSGPFFQQSPTVNQFTSFVDNTKPISNPDMQFVPLTSRHVTPDQPNKVFTLGEHRVMDAMLASQPQQRSVNVADYLTQNVIGASATKPLVSDRNMQVSGQGTAPNEIEDQLKKLMMLQQAQVASSTPQNMSPDSNSVLTSFEAPGMSFGRSVAVSENVGVSPNAVSITPESNVPVTGRMSSFVQQPVSGGLNDGGLNDISGTKRSSNQLSFQFGPSEPIPNNPRSQQNLLWNTEPIFRQTGMNSIATGDQAIPVDIGTGTQVITPGQQGTNMNTLNTFASGLRLGQPVASPAIQPSGPNQPTVVGLMLPMGSNSGAARFTSGGRSAIFGSNTGSATRTFDNSGSGNTGVYVAPNIIQSTACSYEADPTSQFHFIMRRSGASYTFRCALGTAYDPASCECSRRVTASADCLEVHMDFNNGVVEDSSYNKLPIGNQNVEVTNKSTPLSGIALFNSTGKLTIWRYQNYDFRDNVMLKVQFRPGQLGDRFQPLISNCDGGMEGPSIGIIYDNTLKEVLLVLKAVNETKKELSFPINAEEWNDVTYIYDGQEFIGIVNGVRRYVSRKDPHLIGIIGGDIKSMPARGLIEIRDAGIILGHCPRYGYYNGALVDIQIYTCIPKDFRLE